jgi:hypothetical protein
MSPHPRCTIVASRTTDTQPLSHNRQAKLVLRGCVQDSYHPVGGYLHSYLVVGASLHNSKLHKVNTESKTKLACH